MSTLYENVRTVCNFYQFSFHFSAYLDVICRGAHESQLPEKYIAFLKKIAHNDKDAHPELLIKLFGENQ